MINLLVDEAYAFDYLSILQVKKNNNCKNNYDQVCEHLQLQVPNIDQILASQEYQNMIKANQITFQLVDDVRYNKQDVTAKQVDDANMFRYQCKCELQSKFFKNKVTESKT